MQSLLQTRPENLDDLTVQVALVRPGPIQGKAVHPYIEHRQRLREDPIVRAAGRARVAARGAARHARRRRLPGPGARRRDGRGRLLDRRGGRAAPRDEPQAQRGGDRGVPAALRRGLPASNGIDEATAHVIYDKLVGFAGFGFPKSHAAAFALLAYQSAWLRRYYPAEFLCALLNAQPMGFYPPSSLVRDAQRRGVEVRPPHVNRSRGASARSRRAPCASGSATCSRSARPTRRRSRQGSRTPTSAISRGAPSVQAGRARGARRRGRVRRVGAAARAALAARRHRARRDGRAAATASSRCRSSRRPRSPSCPTQTRLGADARRLQAHVDLGRRASAAAAAPASAGRGGDERRAAGDAERRADPGRGDGDRAPAAGDGERRRLHAARGRARPGRT